MHKRQLLIATGILVVALLASTVAAGALDSFAITWHAVTGGGGRSSSASYIVQGSAGQAAAGVANSSGFRLGGGFWYAFGVPPAPTITPTATRTATASPTPTRTTTYTPVVTRSATPSLIATLTVSPTPVVTNTATPTPTPSRTPTRTVTSTPTGPPQQTHCFLPIILKHALPLCHDEFSGPALNACWEWVREDPTHWSLTARAGFLRITTQMNSLFYDANNARNVLLCEAQPGDWEVRTRLIFTPTQNYQMAGLVVYGDDDNFLFLSHGYCGPPSALCMGNSVSFDLEEGGANVDGDWPMASPSLGDVCLRLVKRGATYTGYVSMDALTWTLVGEHTTSVGFPPVRVGLLAMEHNQGAAEIPADFDYFHFEAP